MFDAVPFLISNFKNISSAEHIKCTLYNCSCFKFM